MHIDAKGNDLLPDASDEELIMKKVVTCSQMKLLDHETIHSMHVPSLVLMERAALAVRDEIVKYLLGKNPDGSWQHERVLAVCGSGNNGGDGIAIARLLHLSGSIRRFSCRKSGQNDRRNQTPVKLPPAIRCR